MMGFLFTELIEMSEKRYGLQFIEEVLANAGLTNEGAFTTVGYYTRHDMELLLNSLAQGLGKSKSIVYQELGIHLTNTQTLLSGAGRNFIHPYQTFLLF